MGLMGEQAGKSTMMKCLFGTYQKDENYIWTERGKLSGLRILLEKWNSDGASGVEPVS